MREHPCFGGMTEVRIPPRVLVLPRSIQLYPPTNFCGTVVLGRRIRLIVRSSRHNEKKQRCTERRTVGIRPQLYLFEPYNSSPAGGWHSGRVCLGGWRGGRAICYAPRYSTVGTNMVPKKARASSPRVVLRRSCTLRMDNTNHALTYLRAARMKKNGEFIYDVIHHDSMYMENASSLYLPSTLLQLTPSKPPELKMHRCQTRLRARKTKNVMTTCVVLSYAKHN